MVDGWNEEKGSPPKSYYTTDTFMINGREQLRIYQCNYYWILSDRISVIRFYTFSLLFREHLKAVVTKSNINQSVEFFKHVVREHTNCTLDVKIDDNDLLVKFMEEGISL